MSINLGRFLHTQTGKLLMSLLLGFGLASLFRVSCKDYNCIEFKAPSIEEIKDKIFKVNNKCVMYEPELTKCSKKSKIIEFFSVF